MRSNLRKPVVIMVHIQMIVEVPEDYSKGAVEFKYNDSSYCTGRLIDELAEDSVAAGEECMCVMVDSVEYVRAASEKDIEWYSFREIKSNNNGVQNER